VIVDTSALIAVMRGEPDARTYSDALAASELISMSAGTYLEIAIVVDSRRDPVASRLLDKLIASARIEIEGVTAEQALMARAAYRDFGKGTGHPARLNFGDCFAYALAKVSDRPLLFKGDDFAHTDVTSALAPGQSRT
jgi:ribonuclease VapC